jgi:hypothetical protein
MNNKTKPTNRDAYISEAFRDYLRANLAGFADEPMEAQMELTRMIKKCGTRYQSHSHHPGWSFFTYENMEAKFGHDKFNGINERLGIFISQPDWSKIEKRTKPYKLTNHVEHLRTEFFRKPPKEATNLLAENGDVRHKPPDNAIIAKAKTKTGKLVTKSGWAVPVLSAVPVNQVKLEELQTLMEAELEKHSQGLPTVTPVDPIHAGYVLKDIQLILHSAHNTVSPGCVIHRYEQSASGRMYSKDVNLQTSQRQVRFAALHGLWDYDIENCHYSILQQMAQKAGHECDSITYYLENKSKVRRELAEEFGVTVTQIKKVLLALVYGASLSEDPNAAIPDALGSVDIAEAVYAHPFFNSLAKDIAAARSTILKKVKVFRGGIKNKRGLVMKVKKKKARHLLAHLLQGVEAEALNAAHDLYADKIHLIQHDGFTATTPDLNIAAIEKAIFDATKYRLTVALDERIDFDLKAALFDTDKFSIPTQNPCKPACLLCLTPKAGD